MKVVNVLGVVSVLLSCLCLHAEAEGVGYDNTPFLPGGKWRVHDKNRPVPPVVTPGTASTQEQAGTPPSDAVVLFNGTDLSAWSGSKRKNNPEAEPLWKVENGYMEVTKTGALVTKEEFGDIQLHMEWCAPPPKGDSQSRGNSGVFFMKRYEIQILDSYENRTYADGQAAAIYGQEPPKVNSSRKPGEWQTYDIVFIAPRFEGNELLSPARVTVFHNGLLVHHDMPLLGATAHKKVAKYSPHPPTGPISLQDHGNPMRFRNIWVRRLDTAEDAEPDAEQK